MAEIKTLLDDVIETELANLRTLPSGNEERAKAIRDLAALHKLRIEEIRAQADVDEKSERREMDGRQRREELACKDADRAREEELQNRQLRAKIGIAAAELVLPLMFYGIWMRRGFKFEESGVYSSTTFRNLFSRFRPTK